MDVSSKLIEENIDIYQSLMDEESRILYRANLIWRLLGDEAFYKSVEQLDREKDFGTNELMEYEYFKNPNYRGIILFGCGKNSIDFYYQLKALGYRVIGFCDNKKELAGQLHMGLKVFTPEEVWRDFSDAFIIITPTGFKKELSKQLLSLGYDKKNIGIPSSPFPCIRNLTGRQYFDTEIVRPVKDEVFIDAGAFDGKTILNFVNWCKGDYQEIIGFEPSNDFMKRCMKTIEDNHIERVSLLQAGCYSSCKQLRFDNTKKDTGAAYLSDQGQDFVDTLSIDEVLDGRPATFIKLDIEGAEMEALKGASRTIETYKPRLAVCIYHRCQDAFTIPNFIRSLRSDYKLYIRKYTPHHGEILLYCV